MGGAPSMNHNPGDLMDHHQYPDMNMIFKGIPKMMQVADDMHRMTDYIMDLRNLTIAVLGISVIGLFGFLILKIVHNKSSRKRRRLYQRQLEEGYPPSAPRYYYPSQYAPDPWDRPKHTYSPSLDEKKVADCRNSSPDYSKSNGNYKFGNDSSDSGATAAAMAASDCEKKTSLPGETLSHRGTSSLPKRSLDPVKLVVGDLPYVDSA